MVRLVFIKLNLNMIDLSESLPHLSALLSSNADTFA